MKHATLAKIKREPYPFPMYSQLSNIQGLEQDGELAQQIIRSNDDGARSIVLWTLSEPERVFGYCSFKRQSDAEHNLKFCDSINTILARNLAIFVNDFGVRRFLFLEEDLLTRFSEAVASMKPQISCSLVDLPDGATAD